MRFLNKYLVVVVFVVAFMSNGSFVFVGSCSAEVKRCQSCGRVHDDRMSCKEAAKAAQQGGGGAGGEAAGGGLGATFKNAFTGVASSRTGNLTAGTNIIHSQASNMVSRNFTPYTYGYRTNN